MNKVKLPVAEELDFHYLLSIMSALHSVEEFAWLPELFSIVGHESIVNLCRFAGGETIRIPTTEELTQSIEALQLLYDIEIKKTRHISEVPPTMIEMYTKVADVYHARNN